MSCSTLHHLPSGEFRSSRRFVAEILNPPKYPEDSPDRLAERLAQRLGVLMEAGSGILSGRLYRGGKGFFHGAFKGI